MWVALDAGRAWHRPELSPGSCTGMVKDHNGQLCDRNETVPVTGSRHNAETWSRQAFSWLCVKVIRCAWGLPVWIWRTGIGSGQASAWRRLVAMTRHLPLGVDDFPSLRANPEFLYIDKTKRIAAMLGGTLGRHPHLFLARPRRFGKTLLVSTLQALFQGARTLFADTWIGQPGHWDWEQRQCPVLRLHMGIRSIHDPRRLQESLQIYLARLARRLEVHAEAVSPPGFMLANLIEDLSRKHDSQVAVLVDEYDTPITANIDRPDVLEDILDVMRDFYGALKDTTPYIQCTFMTGITRFARAGLFSGVNHLEDLSFSARSETLLGFTEAEITGSPDLQADMDHGAAQLECGRTELQQALRAYYNGYRFSALGEAVYNPFSLAQCLQSLREDTPGTWTLANLPHAWAESDTPLLLFRLWSRAWAATQTMAWTAAHSDQPLAVLRRANFDARNPDLSALMYYTGYLTLRPTDPTGRTKGIKTALGLDFPNQEVRRTFRAALREQQTGLTQAWYGQLRAKQNTAQWTAAWQTADRTALHRCIDTLMQGVPYPLHTLPARIRQVFDYEVHYQTILYAACQGMGLPIRAEEPTKDGRIDLIIAWPDHIVLIECKVGTTTDAALAQVWRKGYAERYREEGKPITVWGLQFDSSRRGLCTSAVWQLGLYDRNVGQWQHEPLPVPLAKLRYLNKADRTRILQAWPKPS